MTQAVIVAGGKGTRLTSVSAGLPKPLVAVGGTPNIERQIALLARYEVDEIFVTTGHAAGILEERLGDGERFGVHLHHVREERPLGSAGGVAALRGRLKGDFYVLYGDVVVNMDLERLLEFHRGMAAAATLVVHPNDHPFDSDLVDLDPSGCVAALHLKPHGGVEDLPNLVSAGLYVLSAHAIESIEQDIPQDFVHDVFPRLLATGSTLVAYRTTEYLKDMGTPERLKEVDQDIESGKVEASHLDHRRPTAFLDRDGTINVEINGVHRPDQLELVPAAGSAIRRLNRAGWLVACVTNQPDVAKGFISEADVSSIHRRLESQLGRDRAWLDAVAFCPHHPERGFAGERAEFKVECTCRKPAPGLLEHIATVLPVERRRSVVVGDSWRDMAAAHAFGVDAIGVRTGSLSIPAPDAYLIDGRPDIVVDDLSEAVALLLDSDPGIDNLVQRITSASARASGAPTLVLIGGLARAGKSTTAFRLRRELRALNLRPLWVRLDDWIVPSVDRPLNSGLRDRYRLDDVDRAVEELLHGQTVLAPGYDPRTRGALAHPVEYDSSDAGVVIVEGVPSLLIDTHHDPCIRVHVDPDDETERLRRLRVLDELKGLSDQGILDLASTRDAESKAVLEVAATADLHLTPIQLNQ